MSKGMKLFIKFMCFLAVLALIGPFILKTPDGRPLLSLHQVLPDMAFRMPSLPSWESIPDELGEHAGETKVYRWTAGDGSLQFSNMEPENTEYEVVWIDPDTNLIQSLSANTPTLSQLPAQDSQESTINPFPVLSISPEQLEKLHEDVKNVQNLMDERNKSLENL